MRDRDRKRVCVYLFVQGFTYTVGMLIKAPELLTERIWMAEQVNKKSIKTYHRQHTTSLAY